MYKALSIVFFCFLMGYISESGVIMNILYLSDIHFGREFFAQKDCKKRTVIEDQLIETIATLPRNMKPDYIVVTGDIAWTGSEREYEKAFSWFSRLLATTGLGGDRITFCAGNHDVNRKVAAQIPLSAIKKGGRFDLERIDELYKYENINPFTVQIQSYSDFCQRLGVIPYQYYCETESPETDKFGYSKQWYSYAVGSKEIIFGDEKYKIVALNTAMLSGYEEMPDDENFLGLPQVEQMIAQNVIGKGTNHYKIALFHHSERFLNTNEMNSYSERPATLHMLMVNVDLALCGHTETGAVPIIRKQDNDGVLLNGGAAYYSDEHPNSFSVLRIDPKELSIDSCTFIYTKGEWRPTKKTEEITWKEQSFDMHLPGGHLTDEIWKFTLRTDDAKKEYHLRNVDFGLYIDGTERHYHYVNKKDITRLLDVWGNENGIHFGIAPGRERSIVAMIEQCSISHFVDEQIKRGKKQVEYEVTDPKGTIVAQGIMPKFNYSETDYTFYNFLLRLRKLEEAFNVRFSATDTASVAEQCAVTILEGLLEDGGGVFGDITTDKIVYFSEKQYEFREVYEKMSRKEAEVICIGYRVPMVCDLFGARICLGNCRIIVTNLLPCNLEEIKKQADTFVQGDRRRMTMKYVNNQQQIVILKEENEQKSPVVQDLLEKIKDKAISFEVEPQELSFGIDIFKPDEQEVKMNKIRLKNTLSPMIEVYRELWRRN